MFVDARIDLPAVQYEEDLHGGVADSLVAVDEGVVGHEAEAKGRGYDPKAIRKILSIRKKKKEEYQEEEAILEVYMQALGMI